MYNYLKFLGAAAMMLTLFATTSCNRDKPRLAADDGPIIDPDTVPYPGEDDKYSGVDADLYNQMGSK